MRASGDGEGSGRQAAPRERGSSRSPPAALPPAALHAWQQLCALSLLARAPGIQPSFQSVGHLITYRRCEFPEVPLCGPRLKVCFPTPISGSPFGGSDRWVFLSHPSSWTGLGNRRSLLGTDWGGGARKGDKGISWGFLCPILAAQAAL